MFVNWQHLRRMRQARPAAADVHESFSPQELLMDCISASTEYSTWRYICVSLRVVTQVSIPVWPWQQSSTSAGKVQWPRRLLPHFCMSYSYVNNILSTYTPLWLQYLRPFFFFTFPGRDVALPPLGRPQLQHPVIIWWAQLSASLHKSMLTASRQLSEEWWLIGSNICRGT